MHDYALSIGHHPHRRGKLNHTSHPSSRLVTAHFVAVTGTTLTGKAEQWFSHKVECPTHIIHDWTFESMVIGLFQAFITTATAQQAMQWYMQVRFSCKEGITAFHHKLLMWAGQLAQYPDPYSFKRILLNGMPAEYRHHLVLFKGVSAENSSIDEIVQKVQQLERTLISLKSGQGLEKHSEQVATTANDRCQRPTGSHKRQHLQNTLVKLPQGRNSTMPRAQQQRPVPRPAIGDKYRGVAPIPLALKGDTSKLICFKCSKVRHIASDTKCPQYKKPERWQIFAAQIVDDRSDSRQLDKIPEDQEECLDLRAEENLEKKQDEPPDQDAYPDSSQYEDKDTPYNEYNGYVPPLEDEDLVYI